MQVCRKKCKLGQEELIIQQQTQNLFLSEVTMKLQTELQLAEKLCKSMV